MQGRTDVLLQQLLASSKQEKVMSCQLLVHYYIIGQYNVSPDELSFHT